ncbi:MAG: ATP-binding cassette domain-containing protein [Pirellulales bacterium]|nr:ATP-binding cassette domain-containing protein [Pirellulales bacterium]
MVASNTDNPPLVEVERLNVRFGENAVLRDVDLHVRRGETLAVIGESGCGKTVLLKCVAALIQPTTGAVRFDGQDLATLNEQQLTTVRRRYGFVFQQAALFDSMTIGQNVAFPIRQHKLAKEDELQDIVHERLAEVGLPANVVTRKPAELSGGMRKRVGLARALAMNPELLLYDEPTTGLDPIMSDVINELMIATRDRHNVTSILVTHDMKTAHKVADRVVMVYPLSRLKPDEPQVLFDGAPRDLEDFGDDRVSQFVRGEAGARLTEMRHEGHARQ